MRKHKVGRLYEGGMITERCWKVTGYEERVEVVLSGAEQPEQMIVLYLKNGS